MILVDTSAWVDHFRRPIASLAELIADSQILLHPFVYGELLLAGLPTRGEAAQQLQALARAPVASTAETAAFIEWSKLCGTGIGYVDAHLLVSAKLHTSAQILTYDKRLRAQAERLEIAYPG